MVVHIDFARIAFASVEPTQVEKHLVVDKFQGYNCSGSVVWTFVCYRIPVLIGADWRSESRSVEQQM